MNPKWKEPWVTALRSGEYSQGHHMLKGDEGYCCLGVLAHIAADGIRADGWALHEADTHMTIDAGAAASQTILPSALQEYFGIDSETMFTLTSMNDGELDDFDRISNYIEKYL